MSHGLDEGIMRVSSAIEKGLKSRWWRACLLAAAWLSFHTRGDTDLALRQKKKFLLGQAIGPQLRAIASHPRYTIEDRVVAALALDNLRFDASTT
jgi:hypothetical protein